MGDKVFRMIKRCGRCKRIIKDNSYGDYCSYHCREWARFEAAQRYLNTLRKQEVDNG